MKRFFTSKKNIPAALLVFMAALLIFPPFVHDWKGYTRIYDGHYFIFSPPFPVAYIDLIRIAVYWLIAAVACAAWYYAVVAHEKKSPKIL